MFTVKLLLRQCSASACPNPGGDPRITRASTLWWFSDCEASTPRGEKEALECRPEAPTDLRYIVVFVLAAAPLGVFSRRAAAPDASAAAKVLRRASGGRAVVVRVAVAFGVRLVGRTVLLLRAAAHARTGRWTALLLGRDHGLLSLAEDLGDPLFGRRVLLPAGRVGAASLLACAPPMAGILSETVIANTLSEGSTRYMNFPRVNSLVRGMQTNIRSSV